jgi:putative DNA primase/helicase
MEEKIKNKIIDLNKIKQIQMAVAKKAEKEKIKHLSSQSQNSNALSQQFVLTCLKDNEDGDARLLTKLVKNKFCFDHSEDRWYIFNDKYWKKDVVEEIIRSIDKVIEVYGQEAQNQSSKRIKAAGTGDKTGQEKAEKLENDLLKRIHRLQTLNRKQTILQLSSAGKNSLGISGEEWDSDPWLLGCGNGVIDLKSGNFTEGRPDDYIKSVAHTEWLGIDVPAEGWEKFLFEIFNGNQELVDFIQRLFGYAIIGKVIDHIFPILWGEGRNGKGTLLETLREILGKELTGPLPSESLLEQKFTRSGSAPTPDIMKIQGRRIIWSSETGKDRKLNLEKFKWLVGGDTITGRDLYVKDPVDFSPSHILFLLTNEKPHIDAEDFAAWDRIYLIPFTLHFVNEPTGPNDRKKDGELKDKLLTEGPGILAWLVRGCLLYQEHGLNPPDIVKQATKEYRNEEDIYGQFLEECCVKVANEKLRGINFYRAYEEWCGQNGYKADEATRFGINMKKKVKKDRDKKGVYYEGIQLKEINVQDSDNSEFLLNLPDINL